jgi:hypothetical protein
MWTDGLSPMHEFEVMEIVYEKDCSNLTGRAWVKWRARLCRLQSALKARLFKRGLPFSLNRPYPEYLWLEDPVGSLTSKEDFADDDPPVEETHETTPRMTLSRCKEFLSSALATGRKEIVSLQKECAALGCLPGTFRRGLQQLGAKRVREGFGAAGKWYVLLPSSMKHSG